MFKCFALLLLLLAWCTPPVDDGQLTGYLIKPEVTTYMYGTHALENNGRIIAALKSDSVNLDTFTGKKVRLYGKRIEGYPLSGGPELIEVKKIELIKP